MMGKIIIIIGASSDHYGTYAENCPGIYGAGNTVEEAKEDAIKGLNLFIEHAPLENLPDILKNDYEIEFKYDVQSFLKRYSKQFSLSGLEKITGINQKLLSHYVNGRKKPRKATVEKIKSSIHAFAKELSQVHFA